MIDFVFWTIFITILGWLAFPLCAAVFKRAADRGFSVAKVVGLLLWGYLYWLGNLSGLLSNSAAGALSAALLILAAAVLLVRRMDKAELRGWLKEHWRMLAFQEMVFFLAFLIWAIVRGANPEIVGTEKPMELAFINGIYRSPSYPPNDPWLSGYAISYYYFGYLVVAALMHLLGTASGTAFNLAIAMTFALTASTSSGLLVNLLLQKAHDLSQTIDRKKLRRILLISLLAPLFILIVSNGEGFLEMLHSRGIFWQAQADGSMASGFWQWLDIQDLTQAPSQPLNWTPSRLGGTWWWRASRVLQDYTITGQSREVIDEFPFFSYLLADLHPHVLAMPYVLLALYAAFYVLRFSVAGIGKGTNLWAYFKSPVFWFLALTTGSLIFLNTWDFPIYFGLISLAFIVPVFKTEGWGKASWAKFFSFAVSFGVACIFLYFPFLVSLSSQAGGLLPSLVFRTRAVHFWVMFFPQIMVLLVFLGSKVRKGFPWRKWVNVFLMGLIVCLVLFMLSLMIPALGQIGPQLLSRLGSTDSANLQLLLTANQSLLGVYDAQSNSQLITQAIQQFISRPILALGLVLAISLIWMLLFNPSKKDETENNPEEGKSHSSDTFIYLVILMGALLAIFPEFFYLRDQFGWRMNTIFKFYFQVWMLWSLAAAYAVGGLLFVKSNPRKLLLTICAILVIGVGLAYPAFAIPDKTNSFRNVNWSLDGNQYYADTSTLDLQAIQFLDTLPYGTVAEAIGGSYSSYGRVSKYSGYPTVLGWPGHELQWRGGGTEMGSRENDIKTLYETNDWETARSILRQYNIRYVFIGNMERSLYQVSESKFRSYMKEEFSNQDAVIYSWPEASLNAE
jgi:YYY domain-containing protein